MMKKSVLWPFIMLVLMPLIVNANGGPVAELSAMTLSRTPMMRHCPEVQLLREEARFTPDRRYTQVEVTYLLHNRSDKELRELWYGFPVDWYERIDSNRGWATVHPYTDDHGQEVGWHDHYIRDLRFVLDGKVLPWKRSADSLLRKGHPLTDEEWGKIENEEDITMDGVWGKAMEGGGFFTLECDLMRRWYYTSLTIGADEVVELTVSYRIYNHIAVFTELLTLFERETECCRFEYDFSPASYWGDGRVADLYIEVDTSAMRHDADYFWIGNQYTDHGRRAASCYPLKHNGYGRWTLTLHDVDLAKAEPFMMSYHWDLPKRTATELIAMRISPSKYTVVPSGEDKKYPMKNLSDLTLSTTAVLRPDKEGKLHLTLQFKEPMTVTGVIIMGGYAKDSASWHNNSRIEELSFPQFVYAWNSLPGVREPKSYDWQGIVDASCLLATRALDRFFDENHTYYMEQKKVDELKFDITKVIKGDKYDDLCISEIIVLGEPKKRVQ